MDRLTDVFGRDNDRVLKCLCEYEIDGSICDISACPDYCKQFCKNGGVADCDNCGIQQAIDRLAAYEDTGLTPEEAISFKRLFDMRDKQADELFAENERLRKIIDNAKYILGKDGASQ